MSDNYDALVGAAISVRNHAYAPYSGFKVGAALRGDDGKVYVGVNVENAAYGSTICAERAALLAAVSAGCTRYVLLAVATDVAADHLSPPCGACCQMLAEFNPTLPMVLANLDGDRQETSLDQLYTHPFSAQQLEGLAMNSSNNKRGTISVIVLASCAIFLLAIFLLIELINKTAADVLTLIIVAGWMLYLTYTMWKKRSPVQEWLAWIVALVGQAGAIICSSILGNDLAASLIILIAVAGILFFFVSKLASRSGESRRYKQRSAIASVVLTLTLIVLLLLKGSIMGYYYLIIALIVAFYAEFRTHTDQKIDAAMQKQIEGSGDVLKAEPLREKLKQEHQ